LFYALSKKRGDGALEQRDRVFRAASLFLRRDTGAVPALPRGALSRAPRIFCGVLPSASRTALPGFGRVAGLSPCRSLASFREASFSNAGVSARAPLAPFQPSKAAPRSRRGRLPRRLPVYGFAKPGQQAPHPPPHHERLEKRPSDGEGDRNIGLVKIDVKFFIQNTTEPSYPLNRYSLCHLKEAKSGCRRAIPGTLISTPFKA
jgi:hypothetical protein